MMSLNKYRGKISSNFNKYRFKKAWNSGSSSLFHPKDVYDWISEIDSTYEQYFLYIKVKGSIVSFGIKFLLET